MKNYSRAYNRHKQHTKFRNRVRNWFASGTCENKPEEILKAILGDGYHWLRKQSTHCSCSCCAGSKYKREPKNEVIKKEMKE